MPFDLIANGNCQYMTVNEKKITVSINVLFYMRQLINTWKSCIFHFSMASCISPKNMLMFIYIYLVIVIKKCDSRIIYHFSSQILSNMILMIPLINNRVYEGQRHSVEYIYN